MAAQLRISSEEISIMLQEICPDGGGVDEATFLRIMGHSAWY